MNAIEIRNLCKNFGEKQALSGLNMTFRKTYKLAQPKLIIIFPSNAQIKEPKLTENDKPTNNPAKIVPIK